MFYLTFCLVALLRLFVPETMGTTTFEFLSLSHQRNLTEYRELTVVRLLSAAPLPPTCTSSGYTLWCVFLSFPNFLHTCILSWLWPFCHLFLFDYLFFHCAGRATPDHLKIIKPLLNNCLVVLNYQEENNFDLFICVIVVIFLCPLFCFWCLWTC